MKKLLLASLAGGVVLFVWGFLAWAVLPLHDASFQPLPNEDMVVTTLQGNITESGLYYFPGMPEETPDMSEAQRTANMDTWTSKHTLGPIGMIVFHPTGTDPMAAGTFIRGFVIFLIAAFIASWFLARSTAAASSYIARVLYCGMLGVFVSFVSYISNMNWLYMPMDHTTAMVADTIIGWLLAGLAIGAIVKVPAVGTTT
jgi:hypothetical protein